MQNIKEKYRCKRAIGFFLVLLLELYVVYVPTSGKIGLLLAFIGLLYIVLPLILSGIFDNNTFYLYSPAGFAFSLIDDSDISLYIKTTFCLMNILLCIVPTLLIFKRYRLILEQRKQM